MSATDIMTKIVFDRVNPTIGARVHGVPIDQQPSARVVDTLRRGLHEHGVLFFQYDELVDADQFLQFSTLFGELQPVYGFSSSKGGGIDARIQPLKEYRTGQWHTDGTPFERPPQAALLTTVEAPELGGGTMWASMYAAYDGLSSHYQRLLDGLEVVHSTIRTPFIKEQTETVHPAIIRDPVTGKKALFVNSVYSERFLDLSERESDSLMKFLFEHVNQPEYHVSMTWKPGTLVVWEERVTQHRAVDSFVGERKLRRLTIQGDKPAA